MPTTFIPRNATMNAHAGLILSALIIGLSFPAVGAIGEGLPPLMLTALRFAIAAIAITPLLTRLPLERPSAPGLVLYALMGLCLAAFFGTMFWAAHHASAQSMATLYVSVPLMAYGFGRVLQVEGRSPRLLALLLVGAGGALLLIWAEFRQAAGRLGFGPGEAGFLAACLGSAAYPVLSKLGLKRGWLSPHAAARAFWSLGAGAVLIGLAGLGFEEAGALLQMTSRDALVVVYLAVFSTGLTFWLLQRANGVLSPAQVTAYGYLAPFVAMLLLFVTEPDRISWHWLPGSLLVITAIALLLRGDVRPRPPLPVRSAENCALC